MFNLFNPLILPIERHKQGITNYLSHKMLFFFSHGFGELLE